MLGAFIFGMDGDTPEKLSRRAEYIARSGIDVVQRTFLTPLPGTRLFERLRRGKRLLYTDFPADWDHYDMTEVVHRPARMAPGVLSKSMDEIGRRLDGRPRLLRKALQTWHRTRNPMAAISAWQSNLAYRNVRRSATRSDASTGGSSG